MGLTPDELLSKSAEDGRRVTYVDTRLGRVHLRSLMADEYLFYCDETGRGGINLLLLAYSDEDGNAQCCTRTGKGIWIDEEKGQAFADKLPGDVIDQLIKTALSHCFPHTVGDMQRETEKN